MRIRTHLELKQAREALKLSNAAKDRFFSIISHDLRSPFNAIVSFVRLMTESIKDLSRDDIVELAHDLHTSTQKTQTLLENLLEWSQSQTEDMEWNPVPFPLRDSVLDIIATLEHAAKLKEISLKCNISESLLICGDQNMLDTVIRNIISNAVKFTDSGGTVTVSANNLGNIDKISIQDTGIGIPADKIEKLFRIDEQYTTLGTASEKGSGLGLILCNEFIQKHSGTLTIDSTPGKGSTFHTNLPSKAGGLEK